MNGIKIKIRRLKYKLRHDFFAVENVVLVIAIILCLMWTYQSVVAMSRNWELTEKLAKEKRELEVLEIEAEALELENEYYKTDEYQELLARKILDKKLTDENLVIMPDNSESAKNKHTIEEVKVEEHEYSNFEKWIKFLFPSL